ncbi:hypothetical protein VPH35_074659 [Triticum aestivum]
MPTGSRICARGRHRALRRRAPGIPSPTPNPNPAPRPPQAPKTLALNPRIQPIPPQIPAISRRSGDPPDLDRCLLSLTNSKVARVVPRALFWSPFLARMDTPIQSTL